MGVGADRFVLALYEGRPGFFVDVGAADGVKLSNSLLYREKTRCAHASMQACNRPPPLEL
jgi:hypothetical protein